MLLTERQLKLLRDTRLMIDELIAAHYVARPLDNGSGGTSLSTLQPAGTPEPKEHAFNTMHEAVLYACKRQETTGKQFRAVGYGDKWTVAEV